MSPTRRLTLSVNALLLAALLAVLASPAVAAGGWTPTAGSLSTARMNHTATLLPNGQVLVAGGLGNGGALASAELFDPATGRWTATAGGMNAAR